MYNVNFGFRLYGMVSLLAVWLYGLPMVLPRTVKFFYEKRDSEAPPEFVRHVRKVAHLMGIIPDRSDKINVFVTSGMSSMCLGSPSLPGGAYIGVPRQTLWSEVEDTKQSPLYRKGVLVDWSSDFGERLAGIMTPSGSQINFRIAHELGHIKSRHLFKIATLPHVHMFSLFVIIKFVTPIIGRTLGYPDNKINLVVLVTWVILFVIGMYQLRHHCEFEADKMAAGVGRGFAEGGIEMLVRQRQISLLMGEQSDEVTSTHPSCLERQKRLQQIMIDKYQYRFD